MYPTAVLAPASARSPSRLEANAIADLGPAELDRLMGPARAVKARAIVDWLIGRTADTEMPAAAIAHLCESIVDAGVPLDRYGASTETLDAEHDAIGRLWLRGQGVTERIYVRPTGREDDPRYLASPFYAASSTGRWVELWLPETEDDRFGIVPELKAEGFTHYLCAPALLGNGTHSWLTFATRSPAGFRPEDVAVMARILPATIMIIDLRSAWRALRNLLRTYVGTEPQEAILRGNTKRGQVSVIRSAMLFADMRDSVGYTAGLPATRAVEVFNALFDCLVPSIESRRGEVLKYIGDGLLAIFRETKPCDGTCDAAQRALASAEEALRVLEARNREHPDEPPMEVGIALHYGEAAYGNVGSGVRLDFTVIGKDVGLASRIAGLNRSLGEPLLMSEAFVERLRGPALRLGAFPVRGFPESVQVYRPEPPGNEEA